MDLKPNPEQNSAAQTSEQRSGAQKSGVKRWHVISPVALALFLAACNSGLEAPNPELAATADSDSVSVPIRTSSDDAEETASGKMIFGAGNESLDFGAEGQTVGLRFSGVTVPQGATITEAYVKLTAAQSDDGSSPLTIRAQDADSASAFPNEDANISSRTTTGAAAEWSPEAWAEGDVAQTGDLSELVQEVVDRSGWDSGNALALIVSAGSPEEDTEESAEESTDAAAADESADDETAAPSSRSAVSHNSGGSEAAAELYIAYTASEDEDEGDDGSDDGSDEGDEVTTPSAGQGSSCLDDSGDLLELRGTYNDSVNISRRSNVKVDASDVKVNASGLTFIATGNSGSFCLSGGTYSSTLSSSASWDAFHNQAAIYMSGNDNATVERVAVIKSGDGFSIKDDVPDFVVRDTYGNDLRDDWVENDRFNDGTIENNLVDNAFTAFSCREEANRVSPRNVTVTMENNLVALREQSNGSSHNDLFKWGRDTSKGCKLILKNNIFVIENDNAGYINPGQDPKVDYNPLDESACSGNKNTVIYLGDDEGYLAQLKEASPACFTVTDDLSIWEEARADWFDAHPQFSQYE